MRFLLRAYPRTLVEVRERPESLSFQTVFGRAVSSLLLSVCVVTPSYATGEARILLAAELAGGDTSIVEVTLKLGGELVVLEEKGTKKYPLSVTGELRYTEQLLKWSSDSSQPLRSLRVYETAMAKIQKAAGGNQRELPKAMRSIVAEVRDGRALLAGAETPLTRDQFDLVHVVGNSLALNRLLPERALTESESWDHDAAAIGALLGMDHVAVCEVRSVVTGSKHHRVKIRLAGTVHGTIDGAPTEMELRGAYLFHQQHRRITKFNLAIKEVRTATQTVPGLDVVAKISMTVQPSTTKLQEHFSAANRDVSQPLISTLRYEAPLLGYRFLHDPVWYIISEQSDMLSLRSMQEGNQTAHCNMTTLPARSEGFGTTLEEFERDIRDSLGNKLEAITASSQWTTSQSHDCLGVVAQGKVQDVPIEWRYYLIASPGLPRVSLGVTIEQSQLEQFDDADRQMIDSLELLEKVPATASEPSSQRLR